ncbi:MAG: phosphoribosylformylglycinamidine synthase subunit PurQ [Cyanobacteria bacterium HKST-UBA04]|nr:phosphoribosylformylglycinamidine synthase subunit PurQ [Cyanobacteria bacterium HKST-UBA04]
MAKRALVLCGDGINCEAESAHALRMAGIEPTVVHINDLIAAPKQLMNYGLLLLPGGFSFGDEVSSGKVLAVKLRHGLGEVLTQFVAEGRLVVGICNGFQALVKLGLLPGSSDAAEALRQTATLTHNQLSDGHRPGFINRWVWLSVDNRNRFFAGLDRFMLPIRHGEGRLVVGDETVLTQACHGETLYYETDVNGSAGCVAGLTNPQGNVLGLMPHPEACVRADQHPDPKAAQKHGDGEPAGLQLFKNMAAMMDEGGRLT